MTTTYNLTLNQNNDELLLLTITDSDTGAPYPLDASKMVEFYIKTTDDTPDSDPNTIKLSTQAGQITIVDVANGICQVAVPGSAIDTAGALWWRTDVVAQGGAPRKTASCGNLTVKAV